MLYFILIKKDMDKSHIFMLNLLILLGNFYIHKCKWSERKPSIRGAVRGDAEYARHMGPGH